MRGFPALTSPSLSSLATTTSSRGQTQAVKHSPMLAPHMRGSASYNDLEVRLQAVQALHNIASGESTVSIHSSDYYFPASKYSTENECKAGHSATFQWQVKILLVIALKMQVRVLIFMMV